MVSIKKASIAVLFSTIVGCNSGGGNSEATDEGKQPVLASSLLSTSGTVDQNDQMPATHKLAVKAGHAYIASIKSTSGNADLVVADGPPSFDSSPNYLGLSLNKSEDSQYDTISFIPASDMDVYFWAFTSSGAASYQLSVSSNHLGIGDASSTITTFGSAPAYFSFEVEQGKAYKVTLMPSSDNASFGIYSDTAQASSSPALKPISLVAESKEVDNEYAMFIARAAGTYFAVATMPNGMDTTFAMKIDEIIPEPELSVSIDQVTADVGAVTIDYTVTNSGLVEASAFNVHFLSDSASIPPSTATAYSSAISGITAGGYVTGTIVVPTVAGSGTAYAIVDPENAVPEIDDSNNVSIGVPWTKPSLAPQSINFENGVAPDVVFNSGHSFWKVTTSSNPLGSNYSFKAGTISHGQASCFSVSVAAASNLSFQWKVDSQQTNDNLLLYVDGIQALVTNGVHDWATVSYKTPDGAHTYSWCYEKDASISYGLDSAWVDEIQFAAAPPDLTASISKASTDGANVTIEYTVKNDGGASPASTLQAWAHAASAPAIGAAGETSAAVPELGAGESFTSSINISSTAAFGVAYIAVDSPNQIGESNEFNNVSGGSAWSSAASVGYSFEDSVSLLPFVLSGDANWSIDNTEAAVGSASFRSGAIANNQTSCFATNAAGVAVSFQWKVSSEDGFDFLIFSVDGVQIENITGNRGWNVVVHNLSAGPHDIMWCYIKDIMVSAGSDSGWVDDIMIY